MDDAQSRIDRAPLPDASELRRRRNVVIQFFQFMNLNWKMFTLAKQHH
jgi:hypothetical protein